jgi:hypothetical protein
MARQFVKASAVLDREHLLGSSAARTDEIACNRLLPKSLNTLAKIDSYSKIDSIGL